MDTKESVNASVVDQSKPTIVDVAGQLLSSHISLLTMELEEVRQFYWRSLILLTLCLGSGILFFILLTVFVIIQFWDTEYRMVAILGLLGISFLVTLVCGVILIYLRKRTVLFPAIKEELIKDQAMFHDK